MSFRRKLKNVETTAPGLQNIRFRSLACAIMHVSVLNFFCIEIRIGNFPPCPVHFFHCKTKSDSETFYQNKNNLTK